MPTCAFLSFRLGVDDGVSVAASAWMRAFEALGFEVVCIAGEGPVDHVVPGLAIADVEPPDPEILETLLGDIDLVVAENILTIPMNPTTSALIADALRGRPAIIHHHDPPWQRERYRHLDHTPYSDPHWRHVTINELTRLQYAERGVSTTTIHNGFDVHVPPGNRQRTRGFLDVAPTERLVVHPVRAIRRKNVGAAIAIAEQLDATYWLTGPAEEDYGRELDMLISEARCRVIHTPVDNSADIYAAADVVVFPSTWEGFGNPPVEASLHRRPVVVGDYPVARELLQLGFRWFDPTDLTPLTAWLANPDHGLLDENRNLVIEHLSLEVLTQRVEKLLDEAGWLP